ncbi:MAG: cell division protein FtsB [Legionellaceae bacterium]|nr:cell division protein FtsB [Legionellaceae bacterium]HCA90280.1 cell division protein FtsB [Legionellales bacterium]|tara:strand:- start:1006 stop:1275 length:270 start_codon:yes stop_codon:yes gene_type:complete
MRLSIIVCLLILIGLQYKLWFGETSVPKWLELKQLTVQQDQINGLKRAQNQAISADIAELKEGDQALEEQARFQLGMVKQDEEFYQFVN